MDKPPEKVIHSRYADGTPVYDEEQPERLPNKDGNFPLPDPNAVNNPHTRLRLDPINKRIYQGRTFAENGVPSKDIDFTRQIQFKQNWFITIYVRSKAIAERIANTFENVEWEEALPYSVENEVDSYVPNTNA